jgi:hypothetical protein
MPLQSVGEIQASDFGNRMIAVSLQQFHYLGTEGVITAEEATDV